MSCFSLHSTLAPPYTSIYPLTPNEALADKLVEDLEESARKEVWYKIQHGELKLSDAIELIQKEL